MSQGKGKRANLEKLLQSAWEASVRLQKRGNPMQIPRSPTSPEVASIVSNKHKEAMRLLIIPFLNGLAVLAFGAGMTGYFNPTLGLWVMFLAICYWLWEILSSAQAIKLIHPWKLRTGIGVAICIGLVLVPWPHPALEKHTSVEIVPPEILPVEPFVPFHVDEIVKLNMRFHKVGKYPVRNSTFDARIFVRHPSSMTEGQMFSDFKKAADFEPQENMLFSSDMWRWHTYYSDKLTQDDVNGLTDATGKDRLLCMVGAVRWEDETGLYETDLCSCMVPQKHPFPASLPAWGECAGHNGESKLR
jgi:hypothetical protein